MEVSNLKKKSWKVMPATGASLEQTLNQLSDKGFEIFKICDHGMVEQQNKLVPSNKTMMPIFSVIAWRYKQ